MTSRSEPPQSHQQRVSVPPAQGQSAGPSSTVAEVLDPAQACRLAATLDLPRQFRSGDPLPLLWQCVYFQSATPHSDLGPDGHPARPSDEWARFPLRVFGGASTTRLGGGLRLGAPATKISSIAGARDVSRTDGDLRIVTWRHDYMQAGRPVLEERQDVIYLSAPPGHASKETTPSTAKALASLRFDPVLLFRFSALTFNAHRIHYDQRYAEAVEGHRTLVVHGPLLALRMASALEDDPGNIVAISYRARAPVYVDDAPLLYHCIASSVDQATEQTDLCLTHTDGRLAMTLSVTTKNT